MERIRIQMDMWICALCGSLVCAMCSVSACVWYVYIHMCNVWCVVRSVQMCAVSGVCVSAV